MCRPRRRSRRRLNGSPTAISRTSSQLAPAFWKTGSTSAPATASISGVRRPAGDSPGGRHQEAPADRYRSRQGALGGLPPTQKIGAHYMALTKDFRETIRERAQREPVFRKALLSEAIELMLSGDERTGRAILRNYINATVGFPRLEQATAIPATSLMRMFGPKGNPSAKNLFRVLVHLQSQEGVSFELRPQR